MNGPRWIKQWISDMAALNEQFRNDDGLVDFDALGREEYSFRVALITKKFGKSERAREIYRVAKIAYDSSVENGKKGGRPKKSPQDAPNGNAGVDMSDAGNGAASKSPTSRAKNSRCPNSREEFHAFVADNNLHEGLAEEWYAMHEAREWVDKNGNPIKDWRGALYNYCTKTEQKRRTA